jgi:hypothetical protein
MMKIEQKQWTETQGWGLEPPGALGKSAQLVLAFGGTPILEERKQPVEEIRQIYPDAYILGCSTAGEICDTRVSDDSLVVTAIDFEHTQVNGAQVALDEVETSFQAGENLAHSLDPAGLTHVFVLSDGLQVNGSELVRGLTEHLPERVKVSGGLAGDGARFEQTFVFGGSSPERNTIAALGLYGNNRLRVGCGSLGGWAPSGPEWKVTRSEGNVLYELSGHSALELYKEQLGEHAKDLPASGLLFPLKLWTRMGVPGLVRTILAVDETEQSITFAGDIPEGSYTRLMKAHSSWLIEGAVGAANTSYQAIGSTSPDLAVLISCVGRKMVLKQQTDEEVKGVRATLGNRPVLTGFYSYGEISPHSPGVECALHNQTMTVTTFLER